MREIVLVLTFLLAFSLQSHAEERKLASLNDLVAVSTSGFQCAETAPIVVRARNEATFAGERGDLQRLLGGVRASLGFECSKLETLIVQGEVAGRSVYRGVISKASNWTLVDLEKLEEKPPSGTGAQTASRAPGSSPPLLFPPPSAPFATPFNGPSFPCARASRPVERMICGNEQLSLLDRQLDQAFSSSGGQTSATLRSSQNAWMRERDTCREPECVADLYRRRIKELAALTASSSQTVGLPAPSNPAPPAPLGEQRLPAAQFAEPTVPVARSNSSPDQTLPFQSTDVAQGCKIMGAWVTQLLNEIAKPDTTPGQQLMQLSELSRTRPEVFAPLMRDRNFSPYFGKAYDQMTDQEARSLSSKASICSSFGQPVYPAASLIFNLGWEPRTNDRRSRPGPRIQELRELRQNLAASSDWLARMNGTLPGIPATGDGLRSISNLERQAAPHLDRLWPSERKPYQAAIDARRAAIYGQVVTAHLAAPLPSELTALDTLAAGLDEKTATQVRVAINGVLAQWLSGSQVSHISDAELSRFSAYPAVRLAKPALASDPGSPPDRVVWAGHYKCGPNSIAASLVVFGPLKKASSGFLLFDQDSSDHNISMVNPIIFEYGATYDEMLDGMKLTFRKWLVQGTGVLPPNQIDLTFGDLQKTVHGRMNSTCEEFTLHKRDYPVDLISNLKSLQGDASWKPPATLARASGADEFCLVLSAWAKRLRSSLSGRIFDRTLAFDPPSRIFRASVFHPAFAGPYTGYEFSQMNVQAGPYMAVARQVQACSMNPLFFEDRDIFEKVFYDTLNHFDELKSGSQRLQDIEDRASRIGQAADRVSPDPEGLDRLVAYLNPLEAELASAVPETRNAILSSAWLRQTEIANLILRNLSEQSAQGLSLDQLQSVDASVRIVKNHQELLPASSPLLSRAETIIGGRLQTLLTADLEPVQDAPATLDGLVQLKARQSAAAVKFGKLASYPAYQTAMNTADVRAAAIQRDVAQDLVRQVAEAPDASSIRKIRESLDNLQRSSKDSPLTSALWASYRRGLTQWFQAAVDKSPQPQEVVSSPSATASVSGKPPTINPLGALASLPSAGTQSGAAFTSPALKERSLVSAIYQKNFRVVYREKDRARNYVVEMLKEIGPACPGSVSGDFLRSIMKQQLGPDIFSNPEKAGQDIMLNTLKQLGNAARDPGGFMSGQIDQGAFSAEAQADVRVILQTTPCDDPAMKTFVTNAQSFFADPSAGVPISELGMDDICRRAEPEQEASYRKDKYCSCAGPVFEQNLNTTERAYIRVSPRPNFWDVLQLVPDLQSKAGKCAL